MKFEYSMEDVAFASGKSIAAVRKDMARGMFGYELDSLSKYVVSCWMRTCGRVEASDEFASELTEGLKQGMTDSQYMEELGYVPVKEPSKPDSVLSVFDDLEEEVPSQDAGGGYVHPKPANTIEEVNKFLESKSKKGFEW
jgi:hypothetical protein